MDLSDRFAEVVQGAPADMHLDEVALLIAGHARSDLSVDHELSRLDALAGSCPSRTVGGVVSYLFADLGFAGDTRDYHDPRNSYLDQVVTRRLGIPISLSALAMSVGRRLGVALEGVGMPGHFILRDLTDRDLFVDPYHGGAFLDRDGCSDLFRAVHGPDVAFHPEFLDPVGTLDITARMLANLRNAFTSRGDRYSLTWVLRLRTLLPGSVAEDQVDLAAVLASVGRFGDAADEYEAAARRLGGSLGRSYGRSATRLRSRLN